MRNFLLCIFFLSPVFTFCQTKELPFWKDIQAFKKSDSLHFPASNQILFVGSSSFTYWKDVREYFPGYSILNRGFGGSTLKDLIFYFDAVVKPYRAKQVVIYSGENDLAYDTLMTADSVVKRFKVLFFKIRSLGNKVRITYVSMKPSPSRKRLMATYSSANLAIQLFLTKQKNTSFVDVFHIMLDAKGSPLKDIFQADSLHMKASGYQLWQKQIKPYLIRQ